MQTTETATAERSATSPIVLHKRLVTTTTAAEITSLSVSWYEHDRLKLKPTVPFVKIGRAVRYRLSDLLALMEEPAKAA